MTVRFVRLDAHSKSLIDRILARRNAGTDVTSAAPSAPPPAAAEQVLEQLPEARPEAPAEVPEPRVSQPTGAPRADAPGQVQAPRPEGSGRSGRPVISAEALRKQAAASPPRPAAPKPAASSTPVVPTAPVPNPESAPKPAAPAPAPTRAQATAKQVPPAAPKPAPVAPAPKPAAPPRAAAPKPAAAAAQQNPPTPQPPEVPAPASEPAPVAAKPARTITPIWGVPTYVLDPASTSTATEPAASATPEGAASTVPARSATQDFIASAILDHLTPEDLEPSALPTPEPEPPAPVAPAPAPPAPEQPPVSVRPEPPASETPASPVVVPAAPAEPPTAPAAREVPPVPEEPRRPVSPELKGRRRAILDVPVSTPVTAAPPEVVLGIDLGTSQARVAVHHQGTLQLLSVGESQSLPSLLAVDATGQLLVGAAARAEAERSPRHAIHGLRRFLGLRARSPLVRALGGPLPFPITAGPHGDASIALHGRGLLLPELAAQLLRELKSAASTFLGHEATRAVLCVPAHFDDRQRAAMREAGTLAGLDVLRILNAPSAAALAFGHGRVLARKRLLVVELGGGGLDVSVVQLTGDDLEVISTGGDPTVGGMDFDARIAEALASELQSQGLPRPEHPSDWVPLLTAAEAAKVALSEREEVSFPLPGAPAPFSLNRERLEALTADLVQRITLVVRHVLESSALTPQGLDEVLLLGGQGRSPLVRRRLEESLGVPVRADVEAPHSAALGAALLGQGILDAAAGKPGATVSEVLSVPIGVAERGGTLRRVLERNTRLPAEKTLVLPVTPGPLTLALFQGPSPVAAENEYLGTLSFTVERPGEAEVHFSLSQDGTLSLAATLPGVKRHAVTLATDMPEDAELEAVIARSPLEGEPESRPGGLLSGLRKLFGRR
ncbi:Hsp70 family protein [Archangium minus]|uniref:Hsp70 family protein n=2 Tax=Archangium minus TaxID=83450 RepID=A0ABY9XAF6_9BACT|nr:Hsp70 family protein [Archangium minus]